MYLKSEVENIPPKLKGKIFVNFRIQVGGRIFNIVYCFDAISFL